MTGRPTLTTLVLFGGVFALQAAGSVVGVGAELFALALPLGHRPWTLLTSVYAHSGVFHLFSNALALLLLGPLVAYVTTPLRFHAFFVASGSFAGVVQVLVFTPFSGAVVLGASGAIFALLGYALVGNRASERVLTRLPLGRRGRWILFVSIAALLTAATAAPRVALAAHFAGFCVGAAAGRIRLLHA